MGGEEDRRVSTAEVTTEQLLALIAERDREIARLKRGDFTPEEFQSLCHHRDEKPGCTQTEFENGCIEYQRKLFGNNKVED